MSDPKKKLAEDNPEVRVLVADQEHSTSDSLVKFLMENGFYCRFVRSGHELQEMMNGWRPDFIITNLLLPDMNGIALLKKLGEKKLLGEKGIRVFIMSSQNHVDNVKECLASGAADFLVRPMRHQDILARLVLHSQKKRELQQVGAHEEHTRSADYYLNLVDLAVREGNKAMAPEECLHNLTRMLALALKAVRVSVVRCDWHTRTAQVLGSNDRKDVRGLNLQLDKYPEILYVLQKKKLLALDNLSNDPTMQKVAQASKSIQFQSMVVCPVHFGDEVDCVLSARFPEAKQHLSDLEIRFIQLFTQVVGTSILRIPPGSSAKIPTAA